MLQGKHTTRLAKPALMASGAMRATLCPTVNPLLQGERAANKFERDRAKAAVLEEAQIVCSTLSFSGSRSFAQMKRKFDVVVIDEAAQAVEPSVLIPICQGVKQVPWPSSEGDNHRPVHDFQRTWGGLHLLMLPRQHAWGTRAGAPAAKLLGSCSPLLGCIWPCRTPELAAMLCIAMMMLTVC